MHNVIEDHLLNIKISPREWTFHDVRINIPQNSFGSDAINPHTQYSNPVSIFSNADMNGFGASFTLGEGNDMICMAAEYIVKQLEGYTVGDLIFSNTGFYETFTNPLQLRWLSPNSGVPMMAAGLIVNTLLDAASKSSNMPTWSFLAQLPTNILVSLFESRHLTKKYDKETITALLDEGLTNVEDRCKMLERSGLPAYFTTWFGQKTDLVVKQINDEYSERGIKTFKLKIGRNIVNDKKRIEEIISQIPKDINICVDANQTLSLEEAT